MHLRFVIGWAGLLALSLPLLAAEPKNEQQLWQGKWTFAACEFEGQDVIAVVSGMTVTFKDNQVRPSALVSSRFTGTFRLDDKQQPKQVEFELPEPIGGDVPAGKLVGIYRFENGQLTICLCTDPQASRPSEFQSQNKPGVCLLVLKKAS